MGSPEAHNHDSACDRVVSLYVARPVLVNMILKLDRECQPGTSPPRTSNKPCMMGHADLTVSSCHSICTIGYEAALTMPDCQPTRALVLQHRTDLRVPTKALTRECWLRPDMHTSVQLVKEASHSSRFTPVTAAPLQDDFRKAEVLGEHFVDVLCPLQCHGDLLRFYRWVSGQAGAGGAQAQQTQEHRPDVITFACWLREILDRSRG